MKTSLVGLACVLGLMAAIPARAADDGKDVLGRVVPVGKGRPALVLYANRGTREVLRDHAFQFAYSLRQEHPVVVVHVDLRDIPGLFKGTARKEIRKSYAESLDEMRQLFREHGESPPADLDASFFMVADSDGSPHQGLGMEKGFHQAQAQVVSATGQELARGPFPSAAAKMGQAMAAAGAPSVASAATHR
ncbi:hypothetical protein KRR26_10975 [Corallococcus sp. M34]|uniref:hypothetical protein n=1 Tax=Citreicoccus inhibens TaxID=2849499 RepID=UPI001C24E961|nr:hypothetical protein [Citreicoccus inhibens]MBU8896131.1 hypothetical protein [Citreicoccus inhibens]